MSGEALCGLWIDDDGRAWTCEAQANGDRQERERPFRPFGWVSAAAPAEGMQIETLAGEGLFNHLVHADTLERFEAYLKAAPDGAQRDVLRPYESQWLVQNRVRVYEGLPFAQLRRCQLDIETGAAEPGVFGDPRKPGDRVLAIGLQCGARRELLTLGEESDAGEKRLLLALNDLIRELDPDVIEGHNIFKFDLDFLRQ
ncbi:MAG TPA: 3'-5' exonuclease, partial [Lacunisphaera sp.]|nr:3'-5' exonuclease [Lacunisphaera sp.]